MSGYDFDKWVNNIHSKEPGEEWIKEVSSKSRKQSVMNGEKAFKNFFKDPENVGFPNFKKKRNQNVKMHLPKNNATDFKMERHKINVPTLGYVRLKEFGYIPVKGIVKSGTISIKANRYYASVLMEIPEVNISRNNSNRGIGVDVGLKEFAVASNGKVFKNINKTVKVRKLEKRLKRSQRKLSRKYEFKKKRGGTATKNITKQVLRVQKLHIRLSNNLANTKEYTIIT
jgi:putative transposase